MLHSLLFMFVSFFIAAPIDASDCPLELKDLNTCVELEWKRGPVWGGFSQAQVKYWDKSSGSQKNPIEPPKDLIVYPWMIMPNTEHGGRTPSVKKISAGVYLVDQLQFMKMPGYWELRWRHQKDDEQTKYLAKVKVPLPETLEK